MTEHEIYNKLNDALARYEAQCDGTDTDYDFGYALYEDIVKIVEEMEGAK